MLKCQFRQHARPLSSLTTSGSSDGCVDTINLLGEFIEKAVPPPRSSNMRLLSRKQSSLKQQRIWTKALDDVSDVTSNLKLVPPSRR